MITKRDGSTEEFQSEKITRVVMAAGLSEEQARILTHNVTDWTNNHEQEKITTLQIRDRVLEELRKINSYAAGLFEWYEKTKK